VIVLGVDPGLAVTGYGVIESAGKNRLKVKEAGVIRTARKDGIARRLAKIYDNLSEIIEEYSPEALVLEKLYSHYRHPATSILMGHARGVIALAAGVSGIKLVSYPSTRIKKAVTGKGHASKLQIQGMIKELLALKKRPEPPDVSDALACALTYINAEVR